MTVTFLGDARVAYHVQSALEDEGLTARFAGPPPTEIRGGNQALEWVTLYVVEKVVDNSLGKPIDSAIRATVERVVAAFKKQYPNLRIGFDDDVRDPPHP